ncbi:MAG: class II fructose-bisphosphate aldolase [Bacteroidetes bacterium]|nr:class II fructose-bisphosphate aldolase [Bacteroidota bacterium]
MSANLNYTADFERALRVGRPPNIRKLFPNSKALIVSGKYIDLAMMAKGKSIAMAANGRNIFVIRGAMRAAQKANSALIIEIARSEGGTGAYCAVNFWNMAQWVDAIANEEGITVPVTVHADHFGIKKESEIEQAKIEIPTLFEAGITSIAIDASHLPDDKNLLTNIALFPFIPDWAGLETEVGEIKGSLGLSTPEEALFLIRGLNAHNIFPNWIALNNGSAHGIQESDLGIQVDLTAEIHRAVEPYKVSGAQHGTSGNNSDRLREIRDKTRTTKANVATALQMISWGLEVNDYGNATINPDGSFVKIKGEGANDAIWQQMVEYASGKNYKSGDYKKLNLPFENKFLAQPSAVRERMVKRVEDFCFNMMTNVFNATDSAPVVLGKILEKGSYDPGPKAARIENPADWTTEKITERAKSIDSNKGQEGNFDD